MKKGKKILQTQAKKNEWGRKGVQPVLKKIWNFIWYEESLLSWIVNIILAFILVKFIIYPSLGLILGTQFPVVAVVSTSMEHGMNFEEWWRIHQGRYRDWEMQESDFESFKNGFNKGDIMVLVGKRPKKLKMGDVIVYSTQEREKNPIIHRIVETKQENESYFFQTKGDNNNGQLSFEKRIGEEQIIGKAVVRIPYLGWVKIIFTEMVKGVQNAVL